MKTIIILLIFCFGTANAGVYKCKVNGKTVYSPTHCADEGEELGIKQKTSKIKDYSQENPAREGIEQKDAHPFAAQPGLDLVNLNAKCQEGAEYVNQGYTDESRGIKPQARATEIARRWTSVQTQQFLMRMLIDGHETYRKMPDLDKEMLRQRALEICITRKD